jgi:membrane peptidoglycan carboxypeptidase
VATTAAVPSRLGAEGDPDTAVATVVPGDGAIRSLFGGLDFSKTEYDMSSLAGRQIGSSAKPFVYLAALRQGIDPRTTYDGTSGRVVPCYKSDPVNNYAGEDLGGNITVDEALVHSVNVVFAELGCDAGAKNVKQAANDAGIPEDATKSLGGYFLGGFDAKGANALEMASAYATFAARGVRAEPYAIAKILDAEGNTIYEHKVKKEEVFKPEEVGVLNNPLQDVVKRGTGAAAKLPGRQVAGKTGTTQDSVDAWFTGYTPQLATSVWVGFADNHPMDNVHGKRGVTGGSFPAQIFGDLMKTSLDGVKAEPLFTASPDDLDLHRKTPETLVPPPASESTTTSSSTTSSTTSTSVLDTTTTTAPNGRTTSTTTATTAPAPTTTTTTAPKKQTTTTTSTTAPTTTTTAGTSTQSASSGSSTTTTP